MRKILTFTAAAAVAFALPTAAAAQTTETFTANLTQANDSGASGTATIERDGNTLTVSVQGQNFFDGFPHAMHLHGEPGGDNVCGPLNPGEDGFDEIAGSEELADGSPNDTGFVSVVEATPNYGPISVSLTTEGDTSPDSGLAVDRFPDSATLDYQRTFDVEPEVAENLETLHVIVHGADLTGSGEIGDLDAVSSLDPELPFEATAIAACGQLVSSAGSGTGIATGAGGTASDGTGQASAVAAGVLALALTAGVALRRRGATVGDDQA